MILANIASYPPRSNSLPSVIEVIHDQFDLIRLVLNEFDAIPEWLKKYKNVQATIPSVDLKDVGKFLPHSEPDDLVFLLDDDLLYPMDYVSHTIAEWEKIGSPSIIVGYHGSLYERPTSQYLAAQSIDIERYKADVSTHRKVLHFVFEQESAQIVDQLGSGTVMATGKLLPPFGYMEDSQQFVDVRLARWAHERHIEQWALPRPSLWIQQLDTPSSIYESFTLKKPGQVSAEILSFIQTDGK